MSNVVRGLVQGIGITPTDNLTDLKYFTEIAIPETIKIPKAKPDIEQLVSVIVDAEVISVRLINTAVGISNELQNLSGRKLIIELKLRQKIKYVADEPTQSVHAAHFEQVISSIFIVVPTAIDLGDPPITYPIETLFKQGKLVVTPYIEDIYAELRDNRTIFKNIIVLVNINVLTP